MEKNCYMELDLAHSGDAMIIVERNTFSKTANKPKENMDGLRKQNEIHDVPEHYQKCI